MKKRCEKYSMKKQPTIDCVCNVCGDSFKGWRKKDKYCCYACRKRAYTISCALCGSKQVHKSRTRRRYHLCKDCYTEAIKTVNIVTRLEQLQLYEKMFNSQQVQIEELMVENKALKQKVDVLKKQPILIQGKKPYNKNANLYQDRKQTSEG